MKNKTVLSDNIISISAIIIAVISIIVAVWQGIDNRKHNRLSVKPHLGISYNLDYINNVAQYTVKNNGLGPAIIEEAIFISDNDKYKISDLEEFIEFKTKLGLHEISFELLEPESIIPLNESKIILSVKINRLEELGIDPAALMNDYRLIIKYKSLYDEEFIAE